MAFPAFRLSKSSSCDSGGANLRITRNRRRGDQVEAGGSRRKPTEADGSHIAAYPPLVTSIFGVVLAFPDFRFSKSPPATQGNKFTDYAKPPPGRPGGSCRKQTEAIFPPIPTSFPHFVAVLEVSVFPFLQNIRRRYHGHPPSSAWLPWRRLRVIRKFISRSRRRRLWRGAKPGKSKTTPKTEETRGAGGKMASVSFRGVPPASAWSPRRWFRVIR